MSADAWSMARLETLARHPAWHIFERWPLLVRNFGHAIAGSVEFDIVTRMWTAKFFNYGFRRAMPDEDPLLSDALDWCEAQAREALTRREKQQARKRKRHPVAAIVAGEPRKRKHETNEGGAK